MGLRVEHIGNRKSLGQDNECYEKKDYSVKQRHKITTPLAT